MAGDEPSEDAEAGADADEDGEGDAGGDPASDEPADSPGEDGPPTGDPANGGPDDGEGEDEDDVSGESGANGSVADADDAQAVDAADAGDETGGDESEGPTDDGDDDEDEEDGAATDGQGEADETGTNDEADVDGVEVDEAVVAEAEALVEEMEAAVGEDEPEEAPPDEAPPLLPDHEADPEIDSPATPEDVGPDADLDEAPGPSPGDLPDDVGGAVDPADEPDDADEPDAPGGVLGGGPGGPAEDREMPLAEHVEEMLKRLAVVVAVAGFVSLLVFPFAEDVINFLWYSILPGVESEIARPRLYGVLELLFTELKVASLAGLIVALPVMVYETYAFMRPGLYPNERRYYLAAIPTSLVLAVVGVAFAYFVVLPAIFVYFLYYSQDVATIGFALGRTFNLILLMMAYLAVVFQIPLFIMLAMMMGLVTRRWLADRRLLFWGAFLGVSFIFSFDPTGMAPIIVAATMIVLFEGTLLLTKWTGRE